MPFGSGTTRLKDSSTVISLEPYDGLVERWVDPGSAADVLALAGPGAEVRTTPENMGGTAMEDKVKALLRPLVEPTATEILTPPSTPAHLARPPVSAERQYVPPTTSEKTVSLK